MGNEGQERLDAGLPYQHGQIPALGLRPDKKLATCTYKDQIAPVSRRYGRVCSMYNLKASAPLIEVFAASSGVAE
jgi:hypothetical protein